MSETPDMQFNVLSNSKVGDILMLTYIGNGVNNMFPFKTSAKLKNANVNQIFNIEIYNEIDVNVEKGNIYIKKPILGMRGETIIQNKRLQYIPLNDKVGRIAVTPDASNDKSSSWEVVMPLGCDNCNPPKVCKNNKCQSCDEGSYYINGNCEVCNNGIVSDDKLSCFEGGLKPLGYVYEDKPGKVQMADGKWLSLSDVLTFIAGPPDDSSSDECFRYGGCKPLTFWNCIVDAYDWAKDRVNDAVHFVENAANTVGDWAKKAGSDALNWAQGAGNSILKEMIKIGNAISCYARKALRAIAETFKKIAEFLVDIARKADKAFKSAGDWIVGAARTVWDYINKPVGLYIDSYFGGAPCEYYVKRKISKIDGIKSIEPVIVDPIRTQMTVLIKRGIEEILPEFYPFIEILMPFIEDIPGYNDKVNQLIVKLIEVDFIVNSLSSMIDNTIIYAVKSGCSYLDPPDLSGLEIKISDDDEIDDDVPDSPETFRYLSQHNLEENFRYYNISSMTPVQKVAILVDKMKSAIVLYQYIMDNKDKIKKTIKMFTDWNQLKKKICEWTSQNKLLTGLIAILQKAQEKVINSTEQKIIKNKQKLLSIIQKVLIALSKLLVAVTVAKTLEPLLSLVPSGSVSNQIKNIVNKFTKIDYTLLEIIPEFGNACKLN
jgi:hypothetical protein